MAKNTDRKPKQIWLPKDEEFKKLLKQQATDLDYNSVSDMIETRTIKELHEWDFKNKCRK